MSSFYVYVWIDPSRQNTPWYVGKGCGRRAWQRDGARRGQFFRNYLKGMTCEPVVELIPCDSERSAFELEVFLISLIGRRDLGKGTLVNNTDGGEGTSGLRWREESRKKLAASKTGTRLSAETRAKKSEALRGRAPPTDTIAKAAHFHRGRPKSAAQVAKTAAALVGQAHTDERRRNQYAARMIRIMRDSGQEVPAKDSAEYFALRDHLAASASLKEETYTSLIRRVGKQTPEARSEAARAAWRTRKSRETTG